MKGNLDQMLQDRYDYLAVSSEPVINTGGFGWGYVLGFTFRFRISGNIWGRVGSTYFAGHQQMPISGSYFAATSGQPPQKYNIDFSETRLDYRGFEVSIGVELKKKK